MSMPRAPRLDERRAAEFRAELVERARSWIPEWDPSAGEADFGRALLEVAADFCSEVAERLDNAGDKMQRGFLDWLAVRREAARPARVPVVFKLADSAREAVLATAPARLQADVDGAAVVFETEQDVRVLPGRLEVLVGVDTAKDAFYLPPPGLSDLEPLEPLPTQWQLKSFAAMGATKLQLDPELGVVENMILEAGGREYRVVGLDNGIVSIQPGLDAELAADSTVRQVTSFAAFDELARNRQEHALYLGDLDLLDIEAAATIEVVGATGLSSDVSWQYWGKLAPDPEVGWQSLTRLPPPADQSNVALEKLAGAVEPLVIQGKNGRWLRAFIPTVGASDRPFQADTVSIRVNAQGCGKDKPCPPPKPSASAPPAEGMANTTPLVLENTFFPLGKEPRQFDAFYLGCQEAFSKPSAEVQLCFELTDPTFTVLSSLSSSVLEKQVLVGVGKDHALHLLELDRTSGAVTKLRDRDALQPPQPGYRGSVQTGNSVALDQSPSWRLPVWEESNASRSLSVAVPAGDRVWIWQEDSTQLLSGWVDAGQLPNDGTGTIDGLLHFAEATSKLAALRGGRVYLRDLNGSRDWVPLKRTDNTLVDDLRIIVPLRVGNGSIADATRMIAVSETGKLLQLTLSMTGGLHAVVTNLGSNVSSEVSPMAFELSGISYIAAVDATDPKKLRTFTHPLQPGPAREQVLEGPIHGLELALEPLNASVRLHFLASITKDGKSILATWAAFANPAATSLNTDLPTTGGVVVAPTVLGKHLVVPGDRADLFVALFDPSARISKSADVQVAAILKNSSAPPPAGDYLFVGELSNLPTEPVKLKGPAIVGPNETLFPLETELEVDSPKLFAYPLHPPVPLNGTFATPNRLHLDTLDRETSDEPYNWLLIEGKIYEVTSFEPTTRIASLSPVPDPLVLAPGHCEYVRPIPVEGRIAPFLKLDTNFGGSGDWDPKLLDRLPLIFPDEDPQSQRAQAFKLALNNRPEIVVLAAPFTAMPTAAVNFILDTALGDWNRVLGDTSTNPELSWEYWNGKGWWKLNVRDATLNLKLTGGLEFEVPADLAWSDWAGKTNHWIRARLVGGDYGREKVTVITEKIDDKKTEQTVVRTSSGIRPPSVMRLYVSYSVCKSVQPKFVLTQDSGSLRDQSDANRTQGAIVEAFVPLAVALSKLSGPAAAAATAPDAPADCGCQPTKTSAAASVDPADPADLSATTERALFIGFTATLSEAPVNVLLLVDERPYEKLAPLKVEALTAERFVPIVAHDVTRALGESGVLSLAFAVSPTPRELFGQTLSWLRLTPAPGSDHSQWQPSVRGAYLNAVWASATETLTRELLGSSDGSPQLRVTLARPPLLRNTLELRVREPLSDEELKALGEHNPPLVISNVQGLQGNWVLWSQVDDPTDEAADARVYALDEANGEVRFGDGRHGKIPPIGTDNIVAFSYQRTEPDPTGGSAVPGNGVLARAALNLVSPFAGVEAVVTADRAAGGAAPESDARVLRFGTSRLRHRNRALTPRDLEDLALQSSPDLVQARALPHRAYVRLLVVMAGSNPQPSSAQIRELRRLLLEAGPETLAAPRALRIEGPRVRRLRIELKLQIPSLDHAGAVGLYAKAQLARFFDTAIGGPGGGGWRLGVAPSPDDVALALVDAPHVEGMLDVKLSEVLVDGTRAVWPSTLKPNELCMLARDPIQLEFVASEAVA